MSVDLFPGKVCAITGGCGFIGSHLAETLLNRGVGKIILIDSLDYGCIANVATFGEQIEIITHRLCATSRSVLIDIFKRVDFVFHLAAEKHNQSLDDPQRLIDTNVAGTYEVLVSAHVAGVKKVVFTSSLYAYGRMTAPPMSESDVSLPDTVYGMSKLSGEHLCRHFANKFGLSSVCLRYFFVYGPKQFATMGYKSVIIKNFERILNGQNPVVCGDGEQVLDYIFVEDVVEATIRAMVTGIQYDVLNIGSGTGVSVNHLTREMLAVAGKDLPVKFAPPDMTHGSFRVGNVQKAITLLDFRAGTDLRTGLTRTYNWMLSERGQCK